MKRLSVTVLLLGALLGYAQAQSVQQSGTVTPGHAARWITNGVIGDAGTAANGSLTSLGVTNNGGPGICVNSGPVTGAYNQTCLKATTNGGSTISSYAFGGATGAGIKFDINGSLQGFLTATLPVVNSNVACFDGTTGNIKDCGGSFSTVPITVGTSPVNNGTDTYILYNNAGLLGNEQYVPLANGGLGGSQAAATAGQIPVFPGSSGAAVPTSYLQPGTGGAARTWQNKAAEQFAIADFYAGLICDGVTDNAAAIQAAVTAAQTRAVTNGGLPFGTPVIRFNTGTSVTGTSNGICLIQSPITVTGPLAFDGGGLGNSVLLVDNATGGFVFNPSSQYNQASIRNLVIKAGRVNAGTAIQYNGVVTASANNPQFTVENVLIRGDGTNYFTRGIYIDNLWDGVFTHVTLLADGASSATYWASAIEIGNNVLDNHFEDISINGAVKGINITGAHVEGIRIEHSTIINSTYGIYGVTSIGSPHFVVSNSHMSNATGNIYLSGSFAQVIISDNVFYLESQGALATPNGAKSIELLAVGTVTVAHNILAMNDGVATGTVGIVYGTGTSYAQESCNVPNGYATGVTVASGVTGTYWICSSTSTTAFTNSAPSTFFSSAQTLSLGGTSNTTLMRWLDTTSNKTTYWNYNTGVISLVRNDASTSGIALDIENSKLTLGGTGVAGSAVFGNATSGTITLQPVTGALGTVTASLPANTGTIAELNLAQSWTATQTFQTILAGTTNTYDIGTNATTSAFRTIYAGSSFVGPKIVLSSAPANTYILFQDTTPKASYVNYNAGVITYIRNDAVTTAFTLDVENSNFTAGGTVRADTAFSANGAAGVSTTCTITAGNSYVFTFGLLTTKGANCT